LNYAKYTTILTNRKKTFQLSVWPAFGAKEVNIFLMICMYYIAVENITFYELILKKLLLS